MMGRHLPVAAGRNRPVADPGSSAAHATVARHPVVGVAPRISLAIQIRELSATCDVDQSARHVEVQRSSLIGDLFGPKQTGMVFN